MRFKSVSLWSACFLALGLALNPSAGATLTVLSVDPYEPHGNTVYYAASNLTGGFVDSGFRAFDFSVSQDAGTTSDMLLLDVYSDVADFSPTGSQTVALSVYASVSGSGNYEPVPIAAAQVIDSGVPAFCNATTCQAQLQNSHYFGVVYTAKSKVRIGLFPRDICKDVFDRSGTTVTGCDSTDLYPKPTASAAQTFALKVVIGLAADSSSVPASTVTENASLNLRFQATAPSVSCSDANLGEFYFPGDGQILVTPSKISYGSVAAGAPVYRVVVVGANGGAPVTDSTALTAGVNAIASQVDVSGSVGTVRGFMNTTDGNDNVYTLAISAKDKAGVVADFPATCQITGVQTSAVQGFLNESRCFIASAAFADTEAAPVRLLRAFRDQKLRGFAFGRVFIDWYESWSPRASQWLLSHPELRPVALLLLLPLQLMAWLVLQPVWLLVFGSAGLALLTGVGVWTSLRSKETA